MSVKTDSPLIVMDRSKHAGYSEKTEKQQEQTVDQGLHFCIARWRKKANVLQPDAQRGIIKLEWANEKFRNKKSEKNLRHTHKWREGKAREKV